MRMPDCGNVRATHGASEQGKDIVFYSQGASETLLNACVIKNEKISGCADSSTGARTVFRQVEQSLDTVLVNDQGQPENVARAYVIPPHECSPQAMESIKREVTTPIRPSQLHLRQCASRQVQEALARVPVGQRQVSG